MEATDTQTPGQDFEQGVGYALARLTGRELAAVGRLLHGWGASPVPVAEAVQDMADEGLIDTGWVYDYAADNADVIPEDSGATGICLVATLVAAGTPGATADATGEHAFRLYHRIIGVEV